MAIQFWQPGQPGWYDGFWLDADGSRVRYDPMKTEINGQSYVPLTQDPRFANAGTPQSYLDNPDYAKALADNPNAFYQDPQSGQWYMTEGAQGAMSNVMHRSNQFVDNLFTNMPITLGGIASGAALGGAFSGIDALGNAIPAGQSGILSQLGINNPLSSLFSQNPTGTGGPMQSPSSFLNNTVAGELPNGGMNIAGSEIDQFMNGLQGKMVSQPFFSNIGSFAPGLGGALGTVAKTVGPTAASELLKANSEDAARDQEGSSQGSSPAYDQLVNSGQIANQYGPAAASAIGRLLSGTATADDYAKLLGTAGATGLGLLGANAQQNAFKDVTQQYLNLGQPYRDKLQASYAPGFDMSQDPGYKGALDQASNSVLRNLSTSGNPFENPGAVMEAQKYVTNSTALPQLNTYRSQLGSFGQLGTNTAGTASLGGAQTSGGAFDALGYGAGQLTNPNDLSSLLKQLGGLGGFRINTTGLGG